MRCDRAQTLIDPFVDGELDSEDRKAVAAHILVTVQPAPDWGTTFGA